MLGLLKSQLRRNIASGTLTSAAGVAVTLVSYPINLHFLGYESFGLWVVLSTVITLGQLGNLGIGQALTKFVAEEHGRGDWPAIERYSATALAVLGVLGLVGVVALTLLRQFIASAFGLSGTNRDVLLSLTPYVAALSAYILIVQVFVGVLTGLGRLDQANTSQLAGRVVAVLVSSFLLWRGRGISSLIVGNAVSVLALHGLCRFHIRRAWPVVLFRLKAVDPLASARLLRFGAGVFGAQILDMLLQPFNRLILARYVGIASLPNLEIGYSGAMQVRALLESGFRALTPEISRLSSVTGTPTAARAKQISQKATSALALAGIPTFGLLAVLAPYLLPLWLGARFAPAQVGIFRVMLLAAFVSLLAVPGYYVLMGLGRIRTVFASHAVQGLANAAFIGGLIVTTGSVSLTGVGFGFLAGTLSAWTLLWLAKRSAWKGSEVPR